MQIKAFRCVHRLHNSVLYLHYSHVLGSRTEFFVNSKIKFSLFPAINIRLNVNLNNIRYNSLCADMDYFGKYFIIPDKTTYIVSNSFTFGLTIKSKIQLTNATWVN